MSPIERVLWGTLLAFVTVLGFYLWATGHVSAFLARLAAMVSNPPAPAQATATRPPGAKGGP